MSQVPAGEHGEHGEHDEHGDWVRRMRELSLRDAAELVPSPDYPVYGLAAPTLTPATLVESQQVNGEWTSITLRYGPWETATGPHVAVTTAVTEPTVPDPADTADLVVSARPPGREPEAELLRAIDAERNWVAARVGVDEEEPAEPPSYARETLPVGDALVCRHGDIWAARLIDGPAQGNTVTVTVTGRGADMEAVRLGPAGDLRPLFQARLDMLGRAAERRRREPAPVLEPAEGVAALRALADATLASQARIRAAARAGRVPRHPADRGRMQVALWQRAIREVQRIADIGTGAAGEIVISAINHLARLDEHVPWFTSDPRLRDAAIDETLRHAVLGDQVPSDAAQRAWARYWSGPMDRLRRDLESGNVLPSESGSFPPVERAGEPLSDDWLAAWNAWAADA